ncbi:hypothetical protein HMPREF9948_0581 [Propionibacterium sp. 434-HC2]|nr:hypothetical protein HMPREF9948_0581 [Propionibacterium sp. 434-HC2]EGR92519.1 hypothetical protein HMPREF9205_2401 [Cutibacterium acnes SK182]
MDPEVYGVNVEKSKVPLSCRGIGAVSMLILVVTSRSRSTLLLAGVVVRSVCDACWCSY